MVSPLKALMAEQVSDLLRKKIPATFINSDLSQEEKRLRFDLLAKNLATGVRFSPHDLRRTFVTIAESPDLSAYTHKRLLNHRTGLDVTAGYIVLDVERLWLPMRISDHLLRPRAAPADEALGLATVR